MASNLLSPELQRQLGVSQTDDLTKIIDTRSKDEKEQEKKARKKRKRKLERARQAALDAGADVTEVNDADLAPLPVKRPDRALPSRKKGQRNAEEFFDHQRATKRQRKAQEKAVREKEKRDKRKELFAELQKYSLSSEEQKLLQSTSSMSTKETTKSKLTRELKLERAGISVKETMALMPTETESGIAALGGDDDAFERELQEWKPKKKRKSWKVGAPVTGGAKLVKPSVSKDESSDDDAIDEDESDVESSDDKKGGETSNNVEIIDSSNVVDVSHSNVTAVDSIEKTDNNEKGSDQHETQTNSTAKEPARNKDVSTSTPAIFQNLKIEKATVVRVNRPSDISKSRQQLPVCGMEQEIMEAIHENPVVVLCGETGSGKTTQVPQFLLEAGYGKKPDDSIPRGYSTRQGLIAVTQPRRVAAVSMARRVAGELGISLKGQESNTPRNMLDGAVGYQVRYDSKTVGTATRIKFMTDGVLLREARDDLLLRKYSVIVLDEAHERNLNTDILLGILSRVVPLRAQMVAEQFQQLKTGSAEISLDMRLEPLKVVIMSATLRVDDFIGNDRLFQQHVANEFMKTTRPIIQGVDGPYPPPVINVEARQHPVTPHFNRRTELKDYVGAVFTKVCSIHKKLPEGGILVFLTGQREIQWFCKALEQKFNTKPRGRNNQTSETDSKNLVEVAESEEVAVDVDDNLHGDQAEAIAPEVTSDKIGKDEIQFIPQSMAQEDDSDVDYSDIDDSDDEEGPVEEKTTAKKSKELSEEEKAEELGASKSSGGRYDSSVKYGDSCDLTPDSSAGKLHVLPLYSRLPDKEQLRVFQAVPKGCRLVVVATNIAETSITIPNIKYVVDCGREKTRTFDQYSNTSRFEVQWISQASANQRLGRAGRTGPGHCYRIYSSTVMHEHFLKFSVPEISRLPIDDVVLYMRTMAIRDVDQFPFPTAPDPDIVRAATTRLTQIGALEPTSLGGGVTQLGLQLAKLPISARFAKMLVASIASVASSLSTNAGWNKNSLALVRTALTIAAIQSVPSPLLHLGAMQGLSDDESKPSHDDSDSSGSEEDDESSDEDEEGKEKENDSLKARAREVHEMWRVNESDSLGLLRVAGAYLHTEAMVHGKKPKTRRKVIDKFCQEHMLHAQSLQEMSQLRKQLALATAKMLLELSDNNNSDDTKRFADKVRSLRENLIVVPRPPTTERSLALRQAVVSGLLDQVAKKLDPIQARAIMKNQKNATLRRSWPYATCSATAPPIIYIHPHSYAFSNDAKELPDYVAYSEIVEVVRTPSGVDAEPVVQKYARNITVLDASWLWSLSKGTGSQCTPGKPLDSPVPRYDPELDDLRCCIQPFFGAKQWKLPTQWISFEDLTDSTTKAAHARADQAVREGADSAVALASNVSSKVVEADLVQLRARWFAKCLLDGQVVSALKLVLDNEWWGFPSLHAVKVQSRPYVMQLVNALVSGGRKKQSKRSKSSVHSLSRLVSVWKADPKFLRAELAAWVKKEHREEFLQHWDLIVSTAVKKHTS